MIGFAAILSLKSFPTAIGPARRPIRQQRRIFPMALVKTTELAAKRSAGKTIAPVSEPAPEKTVSSRRAQDRSRLRQQKVAERIATASDELQAGFPRQRLQPRNSTDRSSRSPVAPRRLPAPHTNRWLRRTTFCVNFPMPAWRLKARAGAPKPCTRRSGIRRRRSKFRSTRSVPAPTGSFRPSMSSRSFKARPKRLGRRR